MVDDDSAIGGLSRRDCLAYSGAIVGSGLLAGCTGQADEDKPATPATESATETPTETETETPTDTGYAVEMAPVGEVEFESVPENVLVYSLLYADMAVAFGHGDAVNSLGFDAQAGGNTLDAYYEQLPEVSFDHEDLTQLNTGSGEINVSKELFYELDSDLHLADPCLFMSFKGWEKDDIEEIEEQLAPWFGNIYSREHSQPPESCEDDYEYYMLWEISEKVAQVFQESDRFDELSAIYEDLLTQIRSNLPPEEERPTVASVIFMQDTFYPSHINTPGISNAHVRPLGAADAFAESEVDYQTTYDYETMLEVDPDVILHEFGIASYYDVEAVQATLEDHSIGSRLTAVENDAVFASGNPVQGPLMNLFQLEMTAKQLYPEQFGDWPGYVHGDTYPEIPTDERLFDRERVAEIVTESG